MTENGTNPYIAPDGTHDTPSQATSPGMAHRPGLLGSAMPATATFRQRILRNGGRLVQHRTPLWVLLTFTILALFVGLGLGHYVLRPLLSAEGLSRDVGVVPAPPSPAQLLNEVTKP